MSESIPQVVFATDFSDGAEPAGRAALAYATRVGGRLHVLHVTRAGWEEEMLAVLREQAQRFAGVPVTSAVETGSPADRIVAYAQRTGAEVIVLGAHGRTGFTRALLGSVAERVARTAHCPVMTVPRDPAALETLAAATTAEPETSPCLVCHVPSCESICGTCRTRIRVEAEP